MHKCLVQWAGDKIEIVPGDSSYVIASANADTYERTRCISGEIWEKDILKVADYEIPPIQVFRQKNHYADLFVFHKSCYLVLTCAGMPVYVRIQNKINMQ